MSTPAPGFGAAIALLVFLAAVCGPAAADSNTDPHAKHRQMMNEQSEPKAKATRLEIPDVRLLNRNGVSVGLREDVIGDRIVVVDFVYTTCTTICPVLSAILSQVQNRLGDRLGNDVVLVSLSVDPLRDTPQRLQAYSAKLRAGEGWIWLTGNKQTVDDVLRRFGAYTPSFEDHPSMILVGDGRSGEWSRFLGFPGAEKIMEKIGELDAARGAQAAVREK
ncbi:MAG: SCO family protein [Gammaproteobacteria bacterium]|nr:SCO family protein [Gammaproteobacteria bacterium]